MAPEDLIKQDLGQEQVAKALESWTVPIQKIDRPSPFTSFDIYYFCGQTGQFEFPMLPHCSFCIYAANDARAIRLTLKGKEIQRVLKDDWDYLATANAVELATVILLFFSRGRNAEHDVLQDLTGLREFVSKYNQKGERGDQYVIHERRLSKIEAEIGQTHTVVDGEEIRMRAVTLRGWMHTKRNLGVETIHISRDGTVRLEKRKTLSRRIFKRVPWIVY